MCGGTYVEIGGLDGVTYSNSHVFNRAPALGTWKGVLVELSPINYAKLRTNRPNEIAAINAAVCKAVRVLHIVQDKGAVSGVWELADPDFRQQWWPNIKDPEGLSTVDCKPLATLLDERTVAEDNAVNRDLVHDATHDTYFFDFFSLDVEGAEWSVLQSVDWDRTIFGYIFVEADGHDKKKESNIISFLISKGYVYLGSMNRSNWFVNKDFHLIYGDVVETTTPVKE